MKKTSITSAILNCKAHFYAAKTILYSSGSSFDLPSQIYSLLLIKLNVYQPAVHIQTFSGDKIETFDYLMCILFTMNLEKLDFNSLLPTNEAHY